ncbi:MAG TPA: XdhC/CoxI family protein [Roseiarcus sp.]|jgi:xanthine dehydrogenase accessory factor
MGVLEQAALRQAKGQAFALATVVRTVSVTAAKAGAKALIGPDGSIEEGWIGGGCARAAVVKAARQSMLDGRSRLVSIAPKDALAELGAAAGEERGGVFYAKNSCPSQGTMDIFVEPVLPSPRLLILGASPVAVALARLAPSMGFDVTVAAALEEHQRFDIGVARLVGLSPPKESGDDAYVVVSTQGAGDRAALKSAAGMDARYRAFVGSRRKAETLRSELVKEGVSEQALAAIKAPAGLDISAISADEIALSILAEMVAARRRPERPSMDDAID